MASTYSNIKIQLMATGENTTTWGDVTNVNLGTAIEEAIVGSADVAFSNANVTLTLTNTNSTQAARNMRLNLTGTATTGYNLIVPAIEKPYIINNGTDGTITIKNSTGTGVAVPTGKTMWVYNNGTDVVDVVNHVTSLTTTGNATISGNVGIGTSAPGYRLDIASGDTTPGIGYALRIRANTTAAAGGMQFTNSNATLQWGFLSATATSVTLDASSNLAFRTNFTERGRITSEGQFRWGNSATIDTVSFLPFQVTGGIAIDTTTTAGASAMSFFNGQGANTRVGWIGTVGSSTSYNTSSDYRLKNIDGPLQNSGAYIDALNPVQGNWKADGSRFIGLLAHEVQEVSETPIAMGEKDGKEMQAMDYSAPELIANLIAEIQSLRARVAQLEGN
jgi:hypothetical protein